MTSTSHPNRIIIKKNENIGNTGNIGNIGNTGNTGNIGNAGVSVHINITIPQKTDITCLSYNVYNSDTITSLNDIDLSNRVIISGLFTSFDQDNNADDHAKISLLTQRNLNHNIKFFHLNNDFAKPRIVFQKYEIIDNYINNNKFLFDIDWPNVSSPYNISKFLNYYRNFNKSDYYKFKLADFIDLSYISIPPPSIDNIKIELKGIDICNNYDPKYVNYDANANDNQFSKILYYNNADICNNTNDISNLNFVDFANPVLLDNSNNFLLYNKLNNLTTLHCDFINIENANETIIIPDSSSSFDFFIMKGYNRDTSTITEAPNVGEPNVGGSKYGSKILLNKDFTCIDSRIIGENSNLTVHPNPVLYDTSTVFLSYGNSICGLTLKNIFNNVKLEFKETNTPTATSATYKIAQTNKILFYNKNIINSARTVYPNFSNADYLLDNSYNYDYVNVVHNDIQTSNKKNIDLDLADFYYAMNNYDGTTQGELLDQSIYKKRFKTLELLDTSSNITNDYFDNSTNSAYDNTKNNYFIKTDDISYDNINYKINFNNQPSTTVANNKPISFSNIDTGVTTNNLLNYDFRFNYSAAFDVEVLLNLQYKLAASEISDSSFTRILTDADQNLLLNFHKIILASHFTTTAASDFTNVDCIFVYHDPETTTDPSYQYPNNNIQIITNSEVDTLTKAIELLPGARTATSNSVFIPARNGSNLSRKMIQGLIGLNNIPKLLSIQPYDPEIINTRGFINQYQITDECLSNEDRVKAKINATKHDSVKQKRTFASTSQRKQNYANLVRSNARNNLSKNCADSLQAGESSTQTDYANLNTYTPFKLFKTGKGRYLGPK